MKYFIATDIHGSAYWAEKVVEKFRSTNADLLILLGDVYNHGPRNPFPDGYNPLKAAELLNGQASRIIWIKGNCDSEVDEMISEFVSVNNNVVPFNGKKVYFTHGHVYNKSNIPALSQGDILIYGHFHVSEIVDVDGVTCVNVGSCSLPKDGKHTYALLTEERVTVYDFDDNEIVSRTIS